MVLLEALTLSRPVVATRVGGIPEVIEDGVNGLLVESGNIEELADALAVLMRDLTAAERLGEKGRMRVQENFTAQIMAERTADVYRQIVASESLGLTTIAPQEPV